VNGAHDMGGADGFGPVVPEPDEPVFHAEWEARVLALTLAMGLTGEWSTDASRFARENRPPAEYLAKTYYELWLSGLERLLTERGLVGEDELAAGRSLRAPKPIGRILAAADVESLLTRPGSVMRPSERQARFAVGDRVRAVSMHPAGHTRLPRYVRGHVGTVIAVHGAHVFPDSNARAGGERPQWLYTVAFDGAELWGVDGDPHCTVSVDAFEPYLEPVP
jgi:nitrile hydratase